MILYIMTYGNMRDACMYTVKALEMGNKIQGIFNKELWKEL